MSKLSTAKDNQVEIKGIPFFVYFVMIFISIILLIIYIYMENGRGVPAL